MRLIPDGKYKGHTAILVPPIKPFPILDLPLELRQRVFRYLLPEDETIKLKYGSRKLPKLHARKYAAGRPERASILLANKQLHREFTELVYAQTFSVPALSTLERFHLMIKERNWKHIRSVEILEFSLKSNSADRVTTMLREAPRLRKLTIHEFKFNTRNRNRVFEDFLDKLCSLNFVFLVALEKNGVKVLDLSVAKITVMVGGTEIVFTAEEKKRLAERARAIVTEEEE